MKKKRCEGITYLLIFYQALFPVALAADKELPNLNNKNVSDTETTTVANKDVEQWIAQGVTSISETIKNKTNVSDYAKNHALSYSQSLGNQYLSNGVKLFMPSARFRGGFALDDSFKFKSVDVDLLIPVYETTSSILFGQFGLRSHEKSSFDGRTFLNAGIGYRHDVNDWMLGVNIFIDSDIKNNNMRGGAGLEAFRDYLNFSGNYYFPLTDWKESGSYDLHEERPAYGFDIRAKGYLPVYPHIGVELIYEKYYGDKVDIIGNGKLTSDPYATTTSVIYKPFPLLEMTAGYKNANNAGREAHVGMSFNYTFGQPLSEQLNTSKVTLPDNKQNRMEFVSRNYNIVMEYREQDSRITVSSKPVSGLSEESITLIPSVSSRYPIVSYQWTGDAELLAGIFNPQVVNTSLMLPRLPLDSLESKSYGLYLTVTDSRGVSVTSERIPVTVGINTATFKSYIEIVNEDVVVKDGYYHVPIDSANEVVLEWRFVRVRGEDDFAYIRPESFKYESITPHVKSESLGGSFVDGAWIEKVKVTLDPQQATTVAVGKNILARGPDEDSPALARINLIPKDASELSNITQLSIEYPAGTEILNGSTTSPVVGTELKARAECGPQDCTSSYQYVWQISQDGSSWEDIPDVNTQIWKIPALLNGRSLQGYKIRIRAEGL